jgi:hypothetical protein
MYDKLMEQVLQEVERRQHCALLLGRAPLQDLGWYYVNQEPYQAIVIGSLSAYELLHFPNEVCLNALMEGKPVYLWEGGLDYRRCNKTTPRTLYTRLLAAERQLRQWGVEPIGGNASKLITAQEVRRRLAQGLPIEGRLTPMARDILEGRE